MPSKLEALRQGRSVEDSPGVYVRLNPEEKRLEYSTGEILDVSKRPEFFPSSDHDIKVNEQKEQLQSEIGKFPFGKTAGQFAYQFGQKGAITGGLSDWADRLTMAADDYLAKRQAKQQTSQDISKDRPYLSGGATVASFLPDLAATRGMSVTKAAPLLTGIGAGSRIIDEPGDVAGEAAMSAGLGFLLDKGSRFLSNAAARRGLSRQIAREGEEVSARNIAGAAEAEEANLAQRQAFQKEQDWAQREGQARQHQYNLEKVARENEVQQARQAFEEAKAAQSSETQALKEEYQAAQQRYKNALKGLPEEQRMAQRKISERATKYYDSVAEQIPNNRTINTSGLGAEEFIDRNIYKSAIANTSEGKEASRVIRSLFSEGEEISGKELSRRLKELDKVIEQAPRETQSILDQFKRGLGRSVGNEIADSIIYNEMVPSLTRSVSKDVQSVMKQYGVKGEVAEVKNIINQYSKELSPTEFMAKARSGELSEEIARRVFPEFEAKISDLQGLKKVVKGGTFKKLEKEIANYEKAVNELATKVDNSLASAELQGQQAASQARRTTSRRFREAYGVAEPVTPPQPPAEPVYPQPPVSPELPPQPAPPAPVGNPVAPVPQNFTPGPIPQLPQATTMTERAGDYLEKPFTEALGKGKGPYGIGTVGKLSALKYLTGAKVAPAAAVYAGLKGLTSPTAAGEMARASFRNLGLGAIEQWAQKYPSYHDGVLDSPQERRSLVKEIEDDPSIPLEVKALVQSQVNRGKPLNQRFE